MKFFLNSILAIASFATMASAGTLRATVEEPSSNVDRELTTTGDWNGPLFWLQSYGAGANYYLGYTPTNNYAWIKPDKTDKFAYTKDHHLEKYDGFVKTGKCYYMDDYYQTTLVTCDYNDPKQKWLVSDAPEYHGYYTITNAYHGYALEYYPTDTTYYIHGQDWKNVNYYKTDAYKNLLFYKEAAYTKYPGQACRVNSTGGQGVGGGKDYIKYDDTGADDCKKICDKNGKCKGWEYHTSRRCEIWFTEAKYFERGNGFDCYVKEHY